MSMRAMCVAMIAIALSACASTRSNVPAMATVEQPQAYQSTREAQLATLREWSMSGRIAVSNGKDGGSGRIEWIQNDPLFEVVMSAPVTRQSWRLLSDGREVVVEGLEGGRRTGSDARAMLLEATRWDIPVEALAGWVRGIPGAGAEVRFGVDGRLAGLTQDGWTVSYTDWAPSPSDATLAMPARLEATKGEARVRLAIDEWHFGPRP
ncbi:Outer membrane lipoprotein LolB [Lysobacter dokdonensis DS-58]|uniref:Outer-membrane lipoprotein LolB n=1 Tax=Lysobacter dokdonensis DS-58 TaxID=1300345 RepID=A0A0A2WIA3_9GAMM|nr:lipoprotein insertase outer membrane protein LolB [Lysobacter dokdonensis]KGQ19523.1 Outer membrane lipoprotein LolB [Lysobacter dokdonensis DS-58]